MKHRSIEIAGKVDEKGAFFIYGMNEIRDFFRQHPKSKIVGHFEVFQEGSSEALKGYYRNYVLPEVQKGMLELGQRYLLEDVDKLLRSGCLSSRKGAGAENYSELDEMSNQQLIEFIDEVAQLAAEHLHKIIYDPRT